MTDDPTARIDRLSAAIDAAVEHGRDPHPDWRKAIADVLDDLHETIRHADEGRTADAAMHARLAIGGLAGIWFDADEKDRIYLGEDD